jgi:hypothetical protein
LIITRVKVDGVTKLCRNAVAPVAIIIQVSKRTSAVILTRTKKEDSLSMVWFFSMKFQLVD